ncbi:hypothetical protein LZ31DRAFT_552252 [Colletotrichum somersetense]|nr:hypothetical protein LZ31DRAFT_552252 [Colletotrichum somersetense]
MCEGVLHCKAEQAKTLDSNQEGIGGAARLLSEGVSTVSTRDWQLNDRLKIANPPANPESTVSAALPSCNWRQGTEPCLPMRWLRRKH